MLNVEPSFCKIATFVASSNNEQPVTIGTHTVVDMGFDPVQNWVFLLVSL